MSELTPEISPEVIAACQANAEEMAGALTRGIDTEVTVAVGEAATYSPKELPEGLEGPGLAVLLQFGDIGAVALLPAASGLLPDWVAEPDPTGESKLSTLAQELSMLLVPDDLMADQFAATWVENLSEALTRSEPAEAAALVPLSLSAGEQAGQLTLVWPCTAPANLLPAAEEEVAEESATEPAAESTPEPTSESTPAAEPPQPAPSLAPTRARHPRHLSELPSYARHLLKVQVPVSVRLATKKIAVDEVVELGPGSMITFDKNCDGPLDLMVGDQVVATGVVVKVGDKFGLEIDQMIFPEEHFHQVRAS